MNKQKLYEKNLKPSYKPVYYIYNYTYINISHASKLHRESEQKVFLLNAVSVD